MEFKNPAHQNAYNKVGVIIKDLFGEFAIGHDDRPTWSIPQGTTVVHVSVRPWADDDATVCTRAYVVLDVEMTPELMHFLLSKNNEMRFGAFGLDSDGDIFYEHTIVGSSATKEQIKASVMAVLWTADKYDDEIVERWGGRRAMDRD